MNQLKTLHPVAIDLLNEVMRDNLQTQSIEPSIKFNLKKLDTPQKRHRVKIQSKKSSSRLTSFNEDKIKGELRKIKRRQTYALISNLNANELRSVNRSKRLRTFTKEKIITRLVRKLSTKMIIKVKRLQECLKLFLELDSVDNTGLKYSVNS